MRSVLARARLRAATLAGTALLAMTPAIAQETISYTYDGRGRLLKTEHSGTANNGVSSCYAYDAADNRTASAVATSAACVASGGGSAPSFAINNASATEGGTVTFTVTRSGTTSGSYTLNYATANNTATAASDYTSKSGTLTFADGVTSQPVSVTTLQDASVEGNETFYVDLSNASGGATITTSRGTGTITDDDTGGSCSVSFAVNDIAGDEGDTLVFTITKTGSTTSTCRVNYATANGSAIEPNDYALTSGTLEFAPAETQKTVSVTTNAGPMQTEPTETFFLNLSSPTGGATISDSQGVGTIYDTTDPNPCPLC